MLSLPASTICGHGGHLGDVTWTIYTIFVPPSQGDSMQILALIGQAVSEKKMFEIVDDDYNNGR